MDINTNKKPKVFYVVRNVIREYINKSVEIAKGKDDIWILDTSDAAQEVADAANKADEDKKKKLSRYKFNVYISINQIEF